MLDDVASRVIEALQALPLVIVALMALAAVGTSNATVVLVIGFVFTPLIARTVRSAVLIEAELDYVAAARLRGDGALAIMFVEILPNVLPIAIVEMTVRLGYAVFFVASLSFIGFGIQPPSADWGIAIAENYSLIGSYWWTVLFDAGGDRLAGRRRQSGHRRTAERVRDMTRLDAIQRDAGLRQTDALRIEHLDVLYRVGRRERRVLTDLCLTIGRGESYGLVGESGCGKSTAAFAAIRYLARNGRVSRGRILVDGRDLMALPPAELRRLRSQSVSMVYQDPGQALNPMLRIGRQMAEVFEVAEGLKGGAAQQRAAQMLARVQIPSPARVLRNFPHELSGGMQQRVVIAMALSTSPALLILDEPTTGLDATVEAEVLDLIAGLRAEFNNSILFISHNLPVVARMCDRVGVLYAGELIEEGPAEAVFGDPRHPYTVGLLRCVPAYGRRKNHGRLESIPGFLPAAGSITGRCVFVDRCGNATDRCRREVPPLLDLGGRGAALLDIRSSADLPGSARRLGSAAPHRRPQHASPRRCCVYGTCPRRTKSPASRCRRCTSCHSICGAAKRWVWWASPAVERAHSRSFCSACRVRTPAAASILPANRCRRAPAIARCRSSKRCRSFSRIPARR